MAAMQGLKDLWRGRLPLEIAYWRYAIYYGLALNVLATAISLVLIVLDMSIVVAVLVHLVPFPYMIVVMVGVWRSADWYDGPKKYASWARIGVVAWSAFWLAF